MSERLLVVSILEALEPLPDVLAFRNNTGVARVHGSIVRYGLGNGAPDIVCVLAPWGHLMGLEVKLPKQGTEPDQDFWAERLHRFGGTYWVVRSVPEAIAAVVASRAILRNTLPPSYVSVRGNALSRACTKHPTPCARCDGFLAALAERLGIESHTTNENAARLNVVRATRKGT